MAQPDPERAIAQYERAAAGYDRRTRPLRRYRREAIERLNLAAGATVIELGCGTGVNFGDLLHHIGAAGRIIGIDLSPAMLAQAHHRITRHGWRNITLIEAAAHQAPIPADADAALCCFTTDILALPAALAHVLRHVRPGGPIVAVGFRAPAPWLTLVARQLGKRYATTFTCLYQPWRHLEHHLADIHTAHRALGVIHITSGHRKT